MYRSARRTQSGRVVQNGRTAAADGNAAWGDGQSQAGYWAPPARGARLPSYNQVAGAAAAGGYAQPLEIQAGPHSLSSAPRVPAPAVDIQAKRKIRRARRQERNAAMRYEELLIRLEQLILDHGGAEYVTTDSIVQLYQVRHTTRASRPPGRRAHRMLLRVTRHRVFLCRRPIFRSGTSCARSSR
jgi:hypothetical protein